MTILSVSLPVGVSAIERPEDGAIAEAQLLTRSREHSLAPLDRTARQLRAVFWFASLLLAAVHSWTWRHFLNVDGVSYLYVGDAYIEGDFAGAINGHWSPLYSWLLALGNLLLRPSMYWEIGAVHL